MSFRTTEALEGPWHERPLRRIELASGKVLDTEAAPLIMGVLNVTPDSFSDGGRFFRPDVASEHALEMVRRGADVIDVGGESTRPGSEPVDEEEEKRRVIPVIEEITGETNAVVSIDTQKAPVAEAALDAGAAIINDVSALRTDPEMAPLAADRGVPVCLMHMQGKPKTMQADPSYKEVVGDIALWLEERVEYAVDDGVDRDRIFVDPGFGFGKTPQHNLELLRRLHEFHALGCAVMVGTSRKSTIGIVLDADKDERLYGTLATVACAAMSGCHMVRVHDVEPAKDVVKMSEAIRRGIQWKQ
ncbi:MAG: dihydropteroate synthase [Candidatus Brocadiia bacterium]